MNNAIDIKTSTTQGAKQSDARFCGACGFGLPANSKFCPGCGMALGSDGRASIASPKVILGIVGVGLVIFGAVYGLSLLAPESPTSAAKIEGASFAHSGGDVFSDEPLKSLKAAADSAPDSVAAQSNLAEALVNKLNEVKKPGSDLIFAALEVLRKILELEPKNRNALLSLGDIAFNQAIFEKSTDYYARYLELEPKDLDARVNYGNSLLFIGREADALKELNAAFKTAPNDFRIAVSLAVAYKRSGDEGGAKKFRETALGLAPNPEEKSRLDKFLASIGKESSAPGVAPAVISPRGTESAASPEALISEALSSNPVAGPKFAGAKALGSGAFEVKFNDFPMEQMPPFAKAKFFGSLKEKISGPMAADIKTLKFVDGATGRELDSLDLSAK